MVCVTPCSGEGSVMETGPALQVNAMKVPSSLSLTELFKVRDAPWSSAPLDTVHQPVICFKMKDTLYFLIVV